MGQFPLAETEEEGRLGGVAATILEEVILDTMREAVVVMDAKGLITSVNPAFVQMTGYSEAETLGKSPNFYSSGRHDQGFLDEIFQQCRDKGCWMGEVWNRRKSGEVYVEKVAIRAITDADDRLVNYITVSADVSERRAAERVLSWQVNHDVLTKLPNRILFQDRLSSSLMRAQREEQTVALMFIDLDKFKLVNDTLGHTAGDQLLIEAAQRISHCVRQSDTVARIGGDEFTVILPNCGGADIERIAGNIVTVLDRKFSLDGKEAFVSASMGITVYPTDGRDAQTLIKNADAAMYKTKEEGRNGYHFFESQMNIVAAKRAEIAIELKHGLEQGQFELYYQPVIDLREERVIQAEALLRWNHPKWGLVNPSEFITISEGTGFIVKLGHWVLEEAIRQALQWRETMSPPISISVNLSPRQLHQDDLLPPLRDLLDGIPPDIIALEITQNSLMEIQESVNRFFIEVRERGVNITLDDYGTGYSSLSFLRRFPIDYLKIDRSFVDDIETSTSDLSLVATIISMGRTLGVQVIAEGVETVKQLKYLRSMGCDAIQGFYFCPPLPKSEFEQYVCSAGLEAKSVKPVGYGSL
jgi:diguanylate cyclase (GGDEF)-like protein/PAS domain S-box-containing protein|tara:strand:+ start:2720 stop:4474 length:1755 start_codon:yes stop_codon:yes gene_type:complete